LALFFRAQRKRLMFNPTLREWKRFARIMDEPECLPLFFPIPVHASAFCAEDDACALI